MKPFFRNEKRIKRLKAYTEEWIGTPYRHLGKTKGRAANCSFFIGEVMERMKVVTKAVYPKYYPDDWYNHIDTELILDGFLEGEKYLLPNIVNVQLKDEEPMPGDILFMRVDEKHGKIDHVGIFVEKNKFVHGVPNHGVCYSTYGGYWKRKTARRYRLMEWEQEL